MTLAQKSLSPRLSILEVFFPEPEMVDFKGVSGSEKSEPETVDFRGDSGSEKCEP